MLIFVLYKPLCHRALTKEEMGEFGSDTRLGAVVVGSAADGFVRQMMNLLRGCDVDFVHFEDLYFAVGWLAKNHQYADTIVIGRLEQLSAEQGRFFHIAAEKGWVCCCFIDAESARKPKRLAAAIETGAVIIDQAEQVRTLLSRLGPRAPDARLQEEARNRPPAFLKDQFLTTKAELDALLGAGTTLSDSTENGSPCE